MTRCKLVDFYKIKLSGIFYNVPIMLLNKKKRMKLKKISQNKIVKSKQCETQTDIYFSYFILSYFHYLFTYHY